MPRGSSEPQLVTIYWRDIPAQVMAQQGRTRESWILGDRFQVAIDRAAMIAGLEETDDYVNEWRRVAVPCSGDLAELAQQRGAELEEQYPQERVRALAENGGLEPST